MLASSTIDAGLNVQKLTYRPGGPPVFFGVTVFNRSSQFASFQLDVQAAGSDLDRHWYHLSPDISTAKSPGDCTEFKVEILDSPLSNFVGVVNLTVRVFSPQLFEERRLVLRLTVEPGNATNLIQASLPIQRFQVYPRNVVDIPVTVKNAGQQAAEVRLHCTGLDPSWLMASAERRIEIPAQGEATAVFHAQPPGADQVPSQDYPFTLTASSLQGSSQEIYGVLEILPVGFMEFGAQPQRQQIPAKRPWIPNWKARTIAFQLLFKNNSNLLQTVDLEVRKEFKRCPVQIIPERPVLPLGEITPVTLNLTPYRSWIGWPRQLKFEVKPWLSDPRLGSSDPATQILYLKVCPIIPLWLLAALLILTAAIFRPAPIAHLAGVNAVRLSGTSGRSPLVVSASDDCTIRSWSLTDWGDLTPQGALRQGTQARTCTKTQPRSAQGLLAVSQQAVRSLALVPVKNNQVFAGLENGKIQVWDINTGKELYTLKDPKDQTSDRVLDMLFTRSSLSLYSSYGSGTIRSWQRPKETQFSSKPVKILKVPDRFAYQAWSLALSPDEKTLVSAGQFKRLVVWDIDKAQPRQLTLENSKNRGENDFIWDVTFAPTTSVLAAADSDGYITLWDLSRCQKMSLKQTVKDSLPQQRCAQRARWQASQTSIRSTVFTPDQQWLISAGDDGKILAWHLNSALKPDPTQKPKQIAALPSRVTSLELIANEQGVWIASGSEDAQVHLYRFNPGQ